MVRFVGNPIQGSVLTAVSKAFLSDTPQDCGPAADLSKIKINRFGQKSTAAKTVTLKFSLGANSSELKA